MADENDNRGTVDTLWMKRHSLVTRLWHWSNLACLVILLMSGLMIFNAHPRLYWGEFGANPDPAWLQIGQMGDGGGVSIGTRSFDTTGYLGQWEAGGKTYNYAFPTWITMPGTYDLAGARHWHLSLAWIFVALTVLYTVWCLVSGHIRRYLPGALGGWTCYSAPQSLSYLVVYYVGFPLMILSGWAMSPALAAAHPWILDILGGRQTARSIHFIVTFALVAFVFVHVFALLLKEPWNRLRCMFTGRLKQHRKEPAE